MAPSGAKRSARANEPAPQGGMGRHFTSPLKARDTRKQKPVLALGQAMRLSNARARLRVRFNKDSAPSGLAPESSSSGFSPLAESQATGGVEWMDEEAPQVLPPLPTAMANKAASHRRVFDSWEQLLPLLEDPFADYYRSTHAQQRSAIPPLIEYECLVGCSRKAQVVRCLYPLHVVHIQIVTCDCMRLGVLLVQHDVFPASPNRPRIGVSLDVLDIYWAMFERSCDAITALAAALRTVYDRRGFTVVSDRSNLRDRIERKLHTVLGVSEHALLPEEARDQLAEPSPPSAPSTEPSAAHSLTPGHASHILRERCPVCFGHTKWGRPLDQGGDVQLGADGCFSYCHLRSAGDGPIGYTPSFFIPQCDLNTVVSKITQARDNPRAIARPPIPQDAIDGCEATFEATNKKVQRGDPKWYDATGIFLMTCRHGQILFFCNIYTPGEQQRYIVASLVELACQLPLQATILQAYDIGCVVAHGLDLVTFGPRFRPGSGIADHEDVERVWLRTRKTVPITRGQWNSRRIWMIDQYSAFLNTEGQENLGTWIERQDRSLRTKMRAALKTFCACCVPEAELRCEWQDQKEAQTSIRSHAPARLRRQLDKVVTLQTQIDGVEKAIIDAKQTIAVSGAPPDAVSLLCLLEATHKMLNQQAEELYASLNIGGSFPELADLPRPFVHTLLLLNDLKTVIQRRVIASFQEWEALDRAVAGRREPLAIPGDRKVISKRQPALLKLIDRFNENCAKLETLCPVGCRIPIPVPLPTQLTALCLHIIDRCCEEAARLDLDRANLRLWLDEELSIVDNALFSHSDTSLTLPLQERPRLLKYLKHCWAQQLQPQHLASGLPLGFGPTEAPHCPTQTPSIAPSQSLTFSTPPIPFVHEHDAQMSEVDGDLEEDSDPDDPGFTDVPAESRHDAEDGALYPGFIDDPEDAADLIGDDGEGEDGDSEVEEASGLDVNDRFEIRWDSQQPRNLDRSLLQDLHIQNAFRTIIYERFSHFVVRSRVLYTLEIEPADLDRLLAPRGRLNGESINGVLASLYIIFSRQYSPYAAAATLHHSQHLQAPAGPTEYWTKSVWLLPIHRPAEQHWVCAVVDIPSQSVYCYDSLASQSGWRRDLCVGSAASLCLPNLTFDWYIMVLITRMVVLANRNGHPLHVLTAEEPWPVYPMFQVNCAEQTNGYDCGLWVICTLVAVMRGFSGAEVYERDMASARSLLADHICTLPIT
ncbi:hypothetical protein B0H19DRAFT_1076947 [Mycena capillaripes]|nr:hypothetical protein B0H19DRAFT_1076947 [Mycena capillaripes]